MTFDPDTDLILTRTLNAPRAILWECWTTPEHLAQWFVPKPHTVASCELDVRPGGKCNTTFEVEGNLMENNGVYLEVIPGEKLVFTDTYTEGWKPNPEPFMTAIVTFEDAGDGKTTYTAVARHRSPESAKQHADMGFHGGWGTVATQLEAYAQELAAR
ncbi:SRPBCC family protein [Pararhodobacter zhoushanensis]|uniref:SRPBCC family protein n=1 Tax=Pararhodobacter zhoushanensis TaxID=2479545 RepID=UPI000F8C6DBB|nr:SRPBCC family protein [Pararhodobacter zhoushanensis]